MSERPKLDKGLNGETFRNYYYLKKESMDFCRKNNRPVSGSKVEPADRIEYFLNTGKTLQGSVKRISAIIANSSKYRKNHYREICGTTRCGYI